MASASVYDSDLIEQFCAVTGADEVTGQHLLEACSGNLEMAIGMHLDGSSAVAANVEPRRSEAQNAHESTSGACSSFDDDTVRAPIPQKQEVLVDHTVSIDFSFLKKFRDKIWSVGGSSRRHKQHSVFDGFRDFQAEARQQALSVNGDPLAAKRRTLGDLFRPPIELLHKGSLKSAREVGKSLNRWLIVNVQKVTEFVCQTLNRDVWSNAAVKDIVRDNFILWQVYSDSDDGRSYMQFYTVDKWPYVAILDPRTGENMLIMNQLDANSFCEIASEFLLSHPSPDPTSSDSPPRKKTRVSESLVDASEDSQLNAAIAASLNKNCRPPTAGPSLVEQLCVSSDDDENSLDSSDLETFSDDENSSSQPQESGSRPVTSQQPPSNATKVVISSSSSSCGSSSGARQLPANSQAERISRLSAGEVVADLLTSRATAADSDTCDSSAVDNSSSIPQTVGSSSSSSSSSWSSKTSSRAGSSERVENKNRWESYYGAASDPVSSIAFRFPDGVRKTLSLPSTSKLKALLLYVDNSGYPSTQYELVTTFPRRKLSTLDSQATLQELGLFPQETIFVQEVNVE